MSQPSSFSYYFNNAVIIGLFCVLLYVMYDSVKGYYWLVNENLLQNVQIAWNNPDATLEQKWKEKNGADYEYLTYLKKTTPDDAVIWMPADSAVNPEGKESPFTQDPGGIDNKAWALYYLYPRQLVYDTTGVDSVDYVAIVNGYGYRKIPGDLEGDKVHGLVELDLDFSERNHQKKTN